MACFQAHISYLKVVNPTYLKKHETFTLLASCSGSYSGNFLLNVVCALDPLCPCSTQECSYYFLLRKQNNNQKKAN